VVAICRFQNLYRSIWHIQSLGLSHVFQLVVHLTLITRDNKEYSVFELATFSKNLLSFFIAVDFLNLFLTGKQGCFQRLLFNFHIHHTVLIWHQRWKSTSEVSTYTPTKMLKIKSRNGYMPRMHIFLWKTWQIDISLRQVSK
jgi:hypothetical protein